MAQEPADAGRIELPGMDQFRVFVQPQVEQVRQQPDVLPQVVCTGPLGFGQRRIIQIARQLVAARLADLHAGGEIA